MLTGFFQDSDFIFVLQTGFGSGSGFLPLGSRLESTRKNLSPNTADLVLSKITRHGTSEPVSSEISDFIPRTYARSNILHTKYTDKTDY